MRLITSRMRCAPGLFYPLENFRVKFGTFRRVWTPGIFGAGCGLFFYVRSGRGSGRRNGHRGRNRGGKNRRRGEGRGGLRAKRILGRNRFSVRGSWGLDPRANFAFFLGPKRGQDLSVAKKGRKSIG